MSVSSIEMYNLEENKMNLDNIGLHLGCIGEKVIYNSWNYLFFYSILYSKNVSNIHYKYLVKLIIVFKSEVRENIFEITNHK